MFELGLSGAGQSQPAPAQLVTIPSNFRPVFIVQALLARAQNMLYPGTEKLWRRWYAT
jgi:hypothetical protein